MRFLVRLSYDGSHFDGFQRLPNGRGVQNEIEHVLGILFGHPVLVKGASRTDKGVHALGQCVHFDVDTTMSCSKLKYVLNRMLSKYICVSSVSVVSPSFHARHSVVCKTYRYEVYLGEKNPFVEDYAYVFPFSLDVSLMRECAEVFLGPHSFHNFVSGYRENYDVDLFSLDIYEEGDYLVFVLQAKSFYRYMVRSIVGALMDVGRGRVSILDVRLALAKSSKRQFSIAPPEGLYLVDIVY